MPVSPVARSGWCAALLYPGTAAPCCAWLVLAWLVAGAGPLYMLKIIYGVKILSSSSQHSLRGKYFHQDTIFLNTMEWRRGSRYQD